MEKRLKKLFIFLGLWLVSMLVFSVTLWAQGIISQRSGLLKITRPDGSTLTVNKDEALPEIPSGSSVEVISGDIVIESGEGFIQVIVRDSLAVVKTGDRIIVSIEPKTGMAVFKVKVGQINIITGNTNIVVKADQEVQLGLNRATGVVEIKSIKGEVEAVTVGVKAGVPQGGVVRISVDAKTRKVHIESAEGAVTVTSIDGKVIILAKAESIDTEASPAGEIQTFAEAALPLPVPAEEPAEPERPEATPHRP
jgi:hypothetical protein